MFARAFWGPKMVFFGLWTRPFGLWMVASAAGSRSGLEHDLADLGLATSAHTTPAPFLSAFRATVVGVAVAKGGNWSRFLAVQGLAAAVGRLFLSGRCVCRLGFGAGRGGELAAIFRDFLRLGGLDWRHWVAFGVRMGTGGRLAFLVTTNGGGRPGRRWITRCF